MILRLKSTTMYAHGNKLILRPGCRVKNKPFSVYESVEIFSSATNMVTLGLAILNSLQKSRDDVQSDSEGLDMDEFAKMFGERTIGAFEKRASMVSASMSDEDNKVHLRPWKRNGKQGWNPISGIETIFELDSDPAEIAVVAKEYLTLSLRDSRD